MEELDRPLSDAHQRAIAAAKLLETGAEARLATLEAAIGIGRERSPDALHRPRLRAR